ncbi:MAG: PD-(D/E)XK nuclease family protein [Patescibacteria group bacterium]|nr:PD-(D/E)XK nuclease family protein [Patescibacteria group bacterium]
MSATIDAPTWTQIEAELSMSMLDRFARCPRKWMYRYKMGLVPKSLPEYIPIGSAFHAAVAQLYRDWKSLGRQPTPALTLANIGLNAWLSENVLPTEHVALVQDMVAYWWQNEGSQLEQDYAEILSVEEPLPLLVTYTAPGGESRQVSMRCTPDLLARRSDTGRLVLVDHKTVGKIGDSLDFLAIDFQLRSYALSVLKKYGEAPEVDYNLIRRELPPDFTRSDGSKPYSLTPTGKKSTRSTDTQDYVQRVRQVFTPKQLEAFEVELGNLVSDLADAWAKQRFRRSVIKGASLGCATCDYRSACTRELDGERLDGVTLSLTYDKEPLVMIPEAA